VSLSPATQPPSGAGAHELSAATNTKAGRWFELSLVLFVAFGSSIFNAIAILIYGLTSVAPPPSNLHWVASALHEIGGLCLLGYMLWRRGRRFTDIGLRWSLRDAAVGLVVTFVTYIVYVAGATALNRMHVAMFGTLPQRTPPREIFGHATFAALLFALLNPFFEELTVRAYLMTEVIDLTGSVPLAVLLSTAVQFSYHLYYGWWTALKLAFQFLVMSLYYARWRRALPIILTHGFFDLWGVIRLG